MHSTFILNLASGCLAKADILLQDVILVDGVEYYYSPIFGLHLDGVLLLNNAGKAVGVSYPFFAENPDLLKKLNSPFNGNILRVLYSDQILSTPYYESFYYRAFQAVPSHLEVRWCNDPVVDIEQSIFDDGAFYSEVRVSGGLELTESRKLNDLPALFGVFYTELNLEKEK